MTQSADPMEQAVGYMRHQASKGLGSLAALIERTGEDWHRCLESVSEAQANFKPGQEWTVKEVAGHFVDASRGINKQLAEVAAGRPLRHVATTEDSPPADVLGQVLAGARQMSLTDLRAQVRDTFAETHRAVTALKEGEHLNQTFQHPIFGRLNIKEWVAFQRIHSMDHIQQIDKVKADPAYPGA